MEPPSVMRGTVAWCRRHGDAAALLCLLGLSLSIHGGLLAPGRTPMSPHSDLMPSHLGTKDVLRAALAAGETPLWRSDTMLGAPALTDPQALYLHPLHWLFRLMDPLAALGPTYLLMFLLAGLGGYALGRALGCGPGPSLLAGASQLASFKLALAGYAGWASVLPVLCLLPALAAAFLWLLRRPTAGAAWALSALTALSLSGGAPQTLYYLLLWLLPCVFLRGLPAAPPPAARLVRVAGLGLAALTVAVAATLYLWVPLAVDLSLSSRGGEGYDFFVSGHGLSASHLRMLLWPEALGTPLDRSYPGVELWEDATYVGLLPLLGVGLCVARLPALPPLQRYLVLAFVGSLALSFEGPVQRLLFDWLPGYGIFRMPSRMLFVTAVLASALLAVGAERLSPRLSLRMAGVALLAGLVLLGAEGRWYANRYLQTMPASEVRPAADHPVVALAGEAGRVAIVGRSPFNYGWAAGAGLRLFNGYNPFSTRAYRSYVDLATYGRRLDTPPSNWFDLQQIARPDLLREAGVTHVVARTPLSLPGLSPLGPPRPARSFVFYKGFRERTLHLYRMSAPRAPFRFASRVIPVADLDAAAARLARTPLSGQAYVVGPPEAALEHTPGQGRVQVRVARPGRFSLEVTRDAPALLVVAEAFHPGWRATVDGAPVPLLRSNLVFMGVPVPGGSHRVELRFSPPGHHLSVPLSAAAWCALLAAGLWLLLRARRRARATSES